MAPALTDIASRDPGLWLAALGAIDILRQHNDPHNLLDQSWAPESGHGALYLLLTRDDDATVQARVDSASPWLATHPVLDGLHDLRLNRLAGPATLALWIGDGAVVHTVTHVLPGHVTLVTVHPNSVATTGLAVHQYFLRPPAAADPPLRGPPEGLRPGDVVRMWQAQHDFADKRPLVADNRLADVLAWSIGHRCLEPITALLAAYELRRRGQPPNHPQFRSAVTNLLATYPDLPDVAALRRLRDGAGDVHGTPMLTEAASALPEPAVPPDLRRVHDSLWTTWLQPPPPNE